MATVPKTTALAQPAAAGDGANLTAYCQDVARRAKAASGQMATLPAAVKVDWLERSAALLRKNVAAIERANAEDLAAAPGYGLTPAAVDRLRG